MINLSYAASGESQSLCAVERASVSGETVIWSGLWPTGRLRVVLDGDWPASEYGNDALGLLLKAEVGDTVSGPWRPWASIHCPVGLNRVGATEPPWINAPAPAAGTPTRVLIVPTGTVNAGLVARSGVAATWGRL